MAHPMHIEYTMHFPIMQQLHLCVFGRRYSICHVPNFLYLDVYQAYPSGFVHRPLPSTASFNLLIFSLRVARPGFWASCAGSVPSSTLSIFGIQLVRNVTNLLAASSVRPLTNVSQRVPRPWISDVNAALFARIFPLRTFGRRHAGPE